MGSFNITGFQSQLPITYRDEAFIIPGIWRNGNPAIEFTPGSLFTPIALPIFGKYNDYGVLEDIEEDENTNLISSITGIPISDFIRIIDDHEMRNSPKVEEDYQKILKSLSPRFRYCGFNPDLDSITFVMDHKFFYKDCSKAYSVKEGIFDLWISGSEELKEDPNFEINIHKFKFDKKVINNINPNIRIGYYYGEGMYHRSRLLMSIYKEEDITLLFGSLKDKYRGFLGFFDCFRKNSWIFGRQNYSDQYCGDGINDLLPIYEGIINYIKLKNGII